jgi:WXG100 family type VII secretion target
MGADPGDYSVDPDELDEIVGELAKTETALETLTADLDRQVKKLQETWDGLAAKAQTEAHEEWTNGMNACRTALAELRAAARLAHGNYTDAVTANLNLWRQSDEDRRRGRGVRQRRRGTLHGQPAGRAPLQHADREAGRLRCDGRRRQVLGGLRRQLRQRREGGVGAANDIVDAFATLGVLTATTVENHRKANAGSVYGKPPPVYDGSGNLPEGPVDVPEYTPPSALGSDNEDLPEFWNHVVDHLQGWTWPSADTGLLREAATAWKTLGDSVDRLTSYCDTAATMFQGQKSPEVPLAIDAVNDLKTQLTEGAAEFRAIGQSCSDFADQVEQTREVIKGFLQDQAIEAGISVAAGIIVGIFTFGGGAAAGGGIAAWRAVACARKIITALKALKAVKAVADIARAAP